MKQKANNEMLRQQGIALPIIMVILVLTALVTLYTSNTTIKEQQVTTDQYRSEQAFSAAQAGVYAGVERHNKFESEANPENDISSAFTKGSYVVRFCDIWDDPPTDNLNILMLQQFQEDTILCTNPLTGDTDGFKNDARVGILSVGKPDDASGRRTISVVSAPGLKVGGGPPGPPLTARGSIGLKGNITLINRYSNITLWSGEDLDIGSGAVSTYIRPPIATGVWPREEMIYIPNSTATNKDIMDKNDNTKISAVPTSNALSGQNADVLTNDSNLRNLDPDDMFAKVFSSDRSTVREMAKQTGQYYTDAADIPIEQTGLIWLEPPSSDELKKNIGKFESPAFLVVALDPLLNDFFTITTGGTEVYGMIFVFGNAHLSGGPKVYGSMMVTGQVGKNVGAVGGGTISYDPTSLESAPEGLAGLRGIEPGTWKDWGYVK